MVVRTGGVNVNQSDVRLAYLAIREYHLPSSLGFFAIQYSLRTYLGIRTSNP